MALAPARPGCEKGRGRIKKSQVGNPSVVQDELRRSTEVVVGTEDSGTTQGGSISHSNSEPKGTTRANLNSRDNALKV